MATGLLLLSRDKKREVQPAQLTCVLLLVGSASYLVPFEEGSVGASVGIMTDSSLIAVPTDPYPVVVPAPSPTANGAVSDSAFQEEEEPYTIKCICAFGDDDGNTVFCEKCETWQHIECYYHDRNVPDVHYCVDCAPRPLDAKRATERQIRLRERGENGSDRRVKQRAAAAAAAAAAAGAAAAAKREKKKSSSVKNSTTPDPPNGFHQRSELSVARDQVSARKAKAGHNHRSSASVSSVQGMLTSLPPDGRKRGSLPTRPQSPTKGGAAAATSSIPLYSSEFLHLYDHDQGHADMDSNLFASLLLPAELASWVKDPAALSRVAPGRPAREIFTWSDDAALDRSHWPSLSTETVSDGNMEIEGRHPTWKVLKTHDSVPKGGIVGEVKGKIGLLRDYCLDPVNRWQELRHPEPFVFFHPQLPIYIDSRHEGSQLRYARRSCRPNVTMKTFITNDVEYHFCFVAKEDIPASSEITAVWYLDPQLFESAGGVVKQESSDSTVKNSAAICMSNVLAHFGGCACASENCLLASIDRRRYPKFIDTKQANGKRRKVKSKSGVAPTGPGRSGNSRAGSEGTKNNAEYDDRADSRSASGSVRGARSRDGTPALTTPSDFTFGEAELSAREKRKIAAAEKKFQQLEQDQQHASERKRKRSSGQSTHSTPAGTAGSAGQTSYFANHRSSHIDIGSPPAISPTSSGPIHRALARRKTSGSSVQTSSRSSSGKYYVDVSMQTEPDENNVHFISPPPPKKRPIFACRTQLLLKRYQEDRMRLEEQQRKQSLFPSWQTGAPAYDGKEDVKTKDADEPSPSSTETPQGGKEAVETVKARTLLPPPPSPLPWPSTAAHNSRIPLRPDLHVPLPPRAFLPMASPSAISPGTVVTPTMTQSPATLDPLPPLSTPNAPVPSPVKKKLSLGDYLIRKATTPTSEKPPQPGIGAGASPTAPQKPPQPPPSLLGNNININNDDDNTSDHGPGEREADKVDAAQPPEKPDSSSADGPMNVAATASVSS